MIILRYADPCKESKVLAGRHELEGRGFECQWWHFFSVLISVKVNFYNHYVLECEYNTRANSII